MQHSPLVIWVNSPPHVERGAFGYLEDHWPGGVVYAVLGELRDERRAMGWEISADGSQVTAHVRGSDSIEQFCSHILADNPTAFHLVAGLSNITGRALSRIVRSTPPCRVAVFSERPGAYGPLIKRLAARLVVPIKYRWLVRRYRRHVGLLLPLGEAGVETFARYGWPVENLAPFMYCPTRRGGAPKPIQGHGGPLRFIYVGRLSRFTKGTDILLEAADRLNGRWSLEIVGGHGDMVETVRSWAAQRPNVRPAGGATPDEVRGILDRQDVCVVPSRFDGWNVVVNEALYAGRGVIVSDEAVSHELIEASGAGIVVGARSARRLAAAMQWVIDDPSLVLTWSERAVEYAPQISPDTVGRYLFEMLQAVLMQTPGPRPAPPWLRERNKKATE